jgi:hypothetical protein
MASRYAPAARDTSALEARSQTVPDDPADDAATRMLRASPHGFVALEAAGGFTLPGDVDRSFRCMGSAVAG